MCIPLSNAQEIAILCACILLLKRIPDYVSQTLQRLDYKQCLISPSSMIGFTEVGYSLSFHLGISQKKVTNYIYKSLLLKFLPSTGNFFPVIVDASN